MGRWSGSHIKNQKQERCVALPHSIIGNSINIVPQVTWQVKSHFFGSCLSDSKKLLLIQSPLSNQPLLGDFTIIAVNLNPDPFPFSLRTGDES